MRVGHERFSGTQTLRPICHRRFSGQTAPEPYSLTPVAYVKAVGQIEIVLAALLAVVVWREREVWRQLPGLLLLAAGVLLILLRA